MVESLKCDVLLVGYEEWENLGLRYLASYLADHDVAVEIQPYAPHMNGAVLKRIRERAPDVVGFSMIFQRMLGEFSALVRFLRESGVTAHFTVGGHFPTVAYEEVLDAIHGLNSVVRCEGEETLLALLRAVQRNDSLVDVSGLVFRDNGTIQMTPPRPLLKDLDRLPAPHRTGTVFQKRGLGVSSLIASRGCFYDCSFCSIRKFYDAAPGSKRRSRSPENVVAEMKHLYDEYGARIFIFEDDDFLVNTPKHAAWIEQFVSQLRAATLDEQIIWRISCRVDDVTAEMISLMQSAGLSSVYLGIESGSEQGLETFNKRYGVSDIHETIAVLEALSMPYEYGFMILHPDSTFETIREDIEFLKIVGDTGHALVHFTKMLPYAGTAIEQRLKDEGRFTGTVDAPDYTFPDSRIDLLQTFFTQAFHNRNFHREGLVERFRDAKLDAIIVQKFFSDTLNADEYRDTVWGLIRDCNLSCLERMGMAVNFMRTRSETQILENWWLLDKLAHEERTFEARHEQLLDSVLEAFGAR